MWWRGLGKLMCVCVHAIMRVWCSIGVLVLLFKQYCNRYMFFYQHLFRAEELQSLVVGNELHDFQEMETVRHVQHIFSHQMSIITDLSCINTNCTNTSPHGFHLIINYLMPSLFYTLVFFIITKFIM